MNTQTASERYEPAFAAALFDADYPCPPGLMAWNGSDPARRFAIYRNNVVTSLIDALADTYPVAKALVGDEFFRGMARIFVGEKPPRSPVLAEYGHDFPLFIEAFEPARGVPYLADVARLEWLYLSAYHAAEATPLAERDFHAALSRRDELPAARIRLHPSTGVLRSSYAAFSIWAAHQGELDIGTVDPYRPEAVLVVRPYQDVWVVPLRPGASHFLERLGAGLPFGESAMAASELQPGFDLAHVLADMIRAGAAVTFDF